MFEMTKLINKHLSQIDINNQSSASLDVVQRNAQPPQLNNAIKKAAEMWEREKSMGEIVWVSAILGAIEGGVIGFSNGSSNGQIGVGIVGGIFLGALFGILLRYVARRIRHKKS